MSTHLIHKLFEQQVDKTPSQIAIEESDNKISYRDLDKAINFLGFSLKQLGLEKGELVHVMLDSSIDLVVAMMAAYKTGGIYQAVSAQYPDHRLAEMLGAGKGKVMVLKAVDKERIIRLIEDEETGIELESLLFINEGYSIEIFDLKRKNTSSLAFREDISRDQASNPVSPEDSSYIFHTSASTGNSKAILGKHESLAHFISWEIKEFDIDTSFRISQIPPPTFDASLKDILTAICSGATLCIPTPEVKSDISRLIRWIQSSEISLLQTVPSIFRLINMEQQQVPAEKRISFPKLKYVFLAGELLYAKDLQNWYALGNKHVKFVNLYGSTESTILKTFNRIETIPEDPGQIIPIGKAIDGAVVAVINGNKICKKGEIGDVYIFTKYLTKGYLNKPELNEATFVANPVIQDSQQKVYKTGDLGRYIDDTHIEIIGRLDDQVKVNGVRMELKDIESAILKLPQILQAYVATHKNEHNLTELVCYYTGQSLQSNEMREALSAYLDTQLIPSYFIHMEAFPLGINGKINKRKLPLPDKVKLNVQEPLQTEEERALAALWKEILNNEEIGRNTYFYDAGGSSLKAIRLISRIYQHFGKLLKIGDFLQNPTIAHMAAMIAGSQKEHFTEIKPVTQQTHYPLSHAQKRFWISNVLGGNTGDNSYLGYKIEGKLDLDALEKSMRLIIQRHEIMRTIIKLIHDEPRQFIVDADKFDFKLIHHDLSGEEDKSEKLQSYIQQKIQTAFELDQGPLFLVAAVHLAPQEYALIFVIHHIISDEWAEELFLKELLDYYQDFRKGAQPDMTPLPIQYKDYAVWHNELLEGEYATEAENFWLNQFKHISKKEILPFDFEFDAGLNGRAEKVHANIPDGLGRTLNEFAREHDYSIYMLIISALGILFHRYSGAKEIIIGSPVSGRNHPGLQNQLGLFLNTLPLKLEPQADLSVSELLKQVKKMTLDSLHYGEYPFNMLIEKLNSSSKSDNSKLFHFGFTLHEDALDVSEFNHDFKASIIPLSNQSSKSPLWFHTFAIKDQLFINADYDTRLFKESTVSRLFDRLVMILSQLVANPAIKINEIELNDQSSAPRQIEQLNIQLDL